MASNLPKKVSQASQNNAKQFLPEGGSIRRGLTTGQWCGHLPPFRRVSRKWSERGEEGALKEVLRRLWKQTIVGRGLPDYPEGCPFAEYLESSAASSSS